MPTILERTLYSQGLKECSRCHRVLPFEAYYKRAADESTGKVYCIAECIKCSKEHYLDSKDEIRELRRRQNLGVPVGTYELLVGIYGARCAICGTGSPGGRSKESGQFHVDHDHETGTVRGLLCCNCNVGIGMLGHDKRVLLRAIDYLSGAGHAVSELEKVLEIKVDHFTSDKTLDELDL